MNGRVGICFLGPCFIPGPERARKTRCSTRRCCCPVSLCLSLKLPSATGKVCIHFSFLPCTQAEQTHTHTYIYLATPALGPAHTTIYPMAFRKFASLIVARRLFRIALVNSSLAPAACAAPRNVPSPAGKSTVCSYTGILGTSSSGCRACSLRRRFAATRRCFFDLAVRAGR